MESNSKTTGRPKTTEEQFQKWLDDMRPFLQGGLSLYRAMERANITSHKNRIYQKFKLNGWFREKIDTYQATLGELTNESFFILISKINEKTKRGQMIDRNEIQILKTVAEKHRSCQPFFIQKAERTGSNKKAIGKVIERPTITVNMPKEGKTSNN